MAISQATFAQSLRTVRPGLVLLAKRLRRCRQDDAEDLVGQVVLVALQHLDDFDEATGEAGLRKWLNAILYRIVKADFVREAHSPAAAPLDDARTLPSDERATLPAIKSSLRDLSPYERPIVEDWLAGYSREDIARMHRLHRNTVTQRLRSAFGTIRARYSDVEALEMAHALFAACSRRTIYRKPGASWRPWRDRHPPEITLRSYRKWAAKRVK